MTGSTSETDIFHATSLVILIYGTEKIRFRRISSRHAKFEFLSECKEELLDSTFTDVDLQLQRFVTMGEMAAKHI